MRRTGLEFKKDNECDRENVAMEKATNREKKEKRDR